MEKYKYVIAGGGMAAGYAVKELVKLEAEGRDICILSADTDLPYRRPPLSKDLLLEHTTEEKILINKPPFYADNGINLRLGAAVTGADVNTRTVQTASGDTVGFESLLIATGSRVRTLAVPGSDLEGIHYLRSLNDARAIISACREAQRAVVIGGGFIGTEAAAAAAQLGLQTTLVFREHNLLDFVFTDEISEFYESAYRARDVRLVADSEAVEIKGDGRVQEVVLSSGEVLSADLVIVGIGVQPVLEPWAATDLEVDRGVIVDEFLETGCPGVFAAGDVAQWYHPVFDRAFRVEHEDNARSGGKHAAHSMMGDRQPYEIIPMFYSEVFDISWEFWGATLDAQQAIHRGDVSAGDFSTWWLKDGRVVGAFITASRQEDESDLAQEWIKQSRLLDPLALSDDTRPLADLD